MSKNGAPDPPNALEKKLSAIANAADPREIADFSPSPTHHALAGALFSSPKTLQELAENAGVDRSTVSRAVKDPAAVNWILSQGTTYAEACIGAVHARLLKLALTSKSTTAIKLYLERFDKEYKPPAVRAQEDRDEKIHNQFNAFLSMSGPELQAWLKHKERSLAVDVESEPVPSPDETS